MGDVTSKATVNGRSAERILCEQESHWYMSVTVKSQTNIDYVFL